MEQWEVQVALDALGEVINWTLSDRGLAELRVAVAAGELGQARILRVEPGTSDRLVAAAA
ncbi:MAG: hypothetical protein ACYDAG_07070 [Chloroflexota bacterium]